MLDSALKKYFASDAPLFQQIMALQGQVYREQPGRSTQRIEFDGKGYFLKKHTGVGWQEIFKNLFQGRMPVVSAHTEKRAIELLERLAIPTLKIAGYGCRGYNPARSQSFLLTQELTNIMSLEDFCRDWRFAPPLPRIKWRLIKEVARIARILHENGINHRDFYICHFLLDLTSNIEITPKLYVIDLHRAQIRHRTPMRWKIKDLAGLYFSSKDIGLTVRDRWRFMQEYRQKPLRALCTIKEEKTFLLKVEKRGNETYRKHAK